MIIKDTDFKRLEKSVGLLNRKVFKLYKIRSLEDIELKSKGYKVKVVKDQILEFLHQDKEASEDIEEEIPSIRDYSLEDFWKFLNG